MSLVSTVPLVSDDQLPPKSKPRFSTGFSAGDRHERVRGSRPVDFDIMARTPDFQVGYVYGVLEARAGNITDSDAAYKRIQFCWTIYNNGGLPDMATKLPGEP